MFPASANTGNLPQATVTYWDKNFRENLKQQTPFVAVAERLEQPMHSGISRELFQYVPLPGNQNYTSEGVVEQPIPVQVISKAMTVGTLADNVTFSSLSLAAALDEPVVNVGKELAYRLGESLSGITRAVIDAGVAIDSSVQVKLAATSTSVFTTMALQNIRNAVQSLAGRAVKPFDMKSRLFCGVISPFVLGDVLAQTGSNSVNASPIDILKYSGPEGIAKMDELVGTDVTQTVELPSTGVKFFQSNLVTTTANYNPGGGAISGLTALRTYIMGRDGVFGLRLGAPNDTEFGDGQYENIKVYIESNAAPGSYDPSALIPGFCSYRCNYTASLGPDPTLRYRYIDGASAIS
jgi:hypothetical protein